MKRAKTKKSPQSWKFLIKESTDALHLIEVRMTKLQEQDPNAKRLSKLQIVADGHSCFKAIYNDKMESFIEGSITVYFKKVDSRNKPLEPSANSPEQMNRSSFYGEKQLLPLIAQKLQDIPLPDVLEESELSSDNNDEQNIKSETEG
ncbi:Hypothetical predicted protein [Octopus vulgaris]|uniref:Uncharacterized protein n=1 Tax=Octopus vulgaris TaxID=6645 RepID=A0AA36EXX3_OCTVU|nr:Hypothetical predicted protein [Octopus vulgaris]